MFLVTAEFQEIRKLKISVSVVVPLSGMATVQFVSMGIHQLFVRETSHVCLTLNGSSFRSERIFFLIGICLYTYV